MKKNKNNQKKNIVTETVENTTVETTVETPVATPTEEIAPEVKEEVIPIKELTPEEKVLVEKAKAKREKRNEIRKYNEIKRETNYKNITLLAKTIPCKENKDRIEAKLLKKEQLATKREEKLQQKALNMLHHNSKVSEKMLANYRKVEEAKQEKVEEKRKLIKQLTPERIAELTKRRIDRKERLDQQAVEGVEKKNNDLLKFISSQKKRNEKKAIVASKYKTVHTPEQLAAIKADCEKRKEAKKKLALKIAEIANSKRKNFYSVVCSFIRKDDTTYTLVKTIEAPTDSMIRKIALTMFNKWLLKAKTRSKSIIKLSVYPEFGKDLGNSIVDHTTPVYIGDASKKAVSKAMSDANITDETVKQAKETHEKIVNINTKKETKQEESKLAA